MKPADAGPRRPPTRILRVDATFVVVEEIVDLDCSTSRSPVAHAGDTSRIDSITTRKEGVCIVGMTSGND